MFIIMLSSGCFEFAQYLVLVSTCSCVDVENICAKSYSLIGVARMFEGVENRGTWPYVGTLEYISPEVIWNQAIPSGCGCTSPDTWAAGG